nr:hypothetical protein [Microctonus hyperodae filamentous virus]
MNTTSINIKLISRGHQHYGVYNELSLPNDEHHFLLNIGKFIDTTTNDDIKFFCCCTNQEEYETVREKLGVIIAERNLPDNITLIRLYCASDIYYIYMMKLLNIDYNNRWYTFPDVQKHFGTQNYQQNTVAIRATSMDRYNPYLRRH